MGSFKKNLFKIISLILLFLIFFANTFHESYPDEFDNILGGFYITKGILPYKGFFSHHGPVAYYLAAFIALFSGQSFVKFRIILAIFYFSIFLFGFFIFKKSLRQIKNFNFNFFLSFFLLFGIAATYFWGHMLLADSLSAILLIFPYILIFLKAFYRQKISLFDVGIISVFSSLAILNSLAYFYLVFFLILFSLFLYFQKGKLQKPFWKNLLPLLIIALPYILFVLYLIGSKSLNDYYFDNIVYNSRYYIYNYPRPEGSTRINPIRFAIIIAYDFLRSYQDLLVQVKDFNFSFPFNITLALGNVFLFFFFLLKKRWTPLLFLLLMLIYSNARGNPLTSHETDYQSAVYIMFSFFNALFALYALKNDLDKPFKYSLKLLFSFFFLILSVYWFFNLFFLFNKFLDKVYTKYMGRMPLIYDRPVVAPLMNKLAFKNDYCWLGPFEFEELFYTNCKMPSKYHWILPQFEKSEKIKKEFINDFLKNKPKIIFFKKEFSAFGPIPRFFLDFLNKNYLPMENQKNFYILKNER